MRLFGLSSSGPYMASSRRLPNPRPDLLTAARYQIVPGTHGLPMAQVELAFRRDIPTVSNPDMTLCVLLDRSGSMKEAFSAGHVYNVAAAIFNHVAAAGAGAGFDLVFYDDRVSYAGRIDSLETLREAIKNNGPRGATQVTVALRGAIKQYKTRKGLYVIIITDGEFADKVQARQLVVQELLPQVTPENPYAFRLHFVGAGEGVDHAFLRQIEADAAGQGIPLVTQHHHAHLSHSHASILDEMDKAFLGVGLGARFGELTPPAPDGAEPKVTHTAENTTRRTWDGPVGTPDFLPRRVLLGCEYALHPQTLDIGVACAVPGHRETAFTVTVPLPKAAVTTPPPALRPSWRAGFHLPWVHDTPEEEAARADEERRQAEVAERAIHVHEEEQARQRHDLAALAQGGLPIQATERLKEMGSGGDAADSAFFTSDLDPTEAALLRREGFRARGLVSGSAMYHVGQSYASSEGDCEVKVLSDAYNTATELAVTRMQQELRLIGAHGVVGVRLTLTRHEWADKTIEVQVIGTAVDGPGRAPADPWTCDLSGQEWWALHRAGYEPAALVWGHCTWFILTSQSDEYAVQSWNNQELTHWSSALGKARHRALGYVTARAKKHHATGIAGVRFERRLDEVRLTGGTGGPYDREHHDLVVSIIGTAIRVRPNAPAGVTPTVHVLSLRDGALTPVAIGAADTRLE